MLNDRQNAQKGPDARRRPTAAREAYLLYVERAAEGANEADGPFSAFCLDELGQELQLRLHRDLRRGGVGDDQELVGELAAVLGLAPLTAGQARDGDVLDRAVLEPH